MKFVGLISGGKDSHYNILHCIKNGHSLTCLANLRPSDKSQQELNSFMFQTCGHDLLSKYNLVTSIPIEFHDIHEHTSEVTTLTYEATSKTDEIEMLFNFLKSIKEKYDIEAVSVGAILSSYQRNRVEDVCNRLNLKVLSYLWQRDQNDLMREMCDFEEKTKMPFDAKIIKTAAIGLNAEDLGKSLSEVYPKMLKLNKMYDVHICGEGGEFETIVLDSPIFDKGYFKLKNVNVINNNAENDDVYSCMLDVEVLTRERNLDNLKDMLIDMEQPGILSSKWLSVENQIKKENFNISTEVMAVANETPIGQDYEMNVCKVGGLLHIQNIQPTNPSSDLDAQCSQVFKQLFDVLKNHNISKRQILTTTLILKDMSNFQHINRNYIKFFNKIGALPPSRACLGSNLIKCDMQLSVILSLDDKLEKDGLHVQGISYWNPCNIGPYSQFIYPKVKGNNNKVGYMAGQIPLISKSMILVNKFEELNLYDRKDWIRDVVLTFKNYDFLKNTINIKNNLLTTIYISKEYTSLSLRDKIEVVKYIWDITCNPYKVDIDYDTIDNHKFYYEKENFDEYDDLDIENLCIVEVDQLPAHAPIEMGGVVCQTLDSRIDDGEEDLPELIKSQKGIDLLSDDNLRYNYSTKSFNSTDDFLDFMHLEHKYPFQGTVYYIPESIGNKEFFEFENLEYFGVNYAFDYKGQQHAIIIHQKKINI
ncbi:hypothetical protein ACO0OE_002728 [Hanseniaspora uvarum]